VTAAFALRADIKPSDTGQHDMFRSRLDQIIHMGHEKVVLADQPSARDEAKRLLEQVEQRRQHRQGR